MAEGVETLDQVTGLRMLGCHIAQGYFFSHPLPANEFDELLNGTSLVPPRVERAQAAVQDGR